jgi:hypothetical protein
LEKVGDDWSFEAPFLTANPPRWHYQYGGHPLMTRNSDTAAGSRGNWQAGRLPYNQARQKNYFHFALNSLT